MLIKIYNKGQVVMKLKMEPYKEELISRSAQFPVDIFIRDNLKEYIVAHPHWHECNEILYMLEGESSMQINNRYFTAYKNDLIILNEGDIHSAFCNYGENVRILVIKFMRNIIDNSFTSFFESKYIMSFLNCSSESIYHLTDTSKNYVSIFNLMMGLYEEFTKKETGYEIYIKGLFYQLIASLMRDGIVTACNKVYNEQDLIKLNTLLTYIENNYNSKFSLPEAAAMMNLSCSYFSRYFKKITGRTFKEYIDFVRISEVEKIILSDRMNISQAAFEAGFVNVSSFNRVFKRIKGYSPREIKRSKTANN